MNSLSWLIYLAGVTDGVGGFLTFITVVIMIATVIFGIVTLALLNETDACRRSNPPEWTANRRVVRKNMLGVATKLLACGILIGLLSAIVPSRQTVLLIAASEIGERVVNSEKMARVGDRMTAVIDPSIDLLNTYIKKEVASLHAQIEKSTTPAPQSK